MHMTKPVAVELCCHATALILNPRRKYFALPSKICFCTCHFYIFVEFPMFCNMENFKGLFPNENRAVVMVIAWVKIVNTNSKCDDEVKYQIEK